jgi:biotin-dependent carboxylase-like uncharacterized protein
VIVVRRPGLLTTVQDLGRPGTAHLGVPRSGAVDVPALLRANRLVGNAPGAAALEVTALGPDLLFEVDATVAVYDRARFLPAGTELSVGQVPRGLRGYVAVRGGLDVPAALGSRSTCTLSGLGPPPLRSGDRLEVGLEVLGEPRLVEVPALPPAPKLRLRPGPRDDALADGGWEQLLSTGWTVASDSDRTGLRLNGPALPRAEAGELASEGVVVGSVQLLPDGRPVLFLAGCPPTGGYPVVGVVREEDLWIAGQLPPGAVVRFAQVPLPGRNSDAAGESPRASPAPRAGPS